MALVVLTAGLVLVVELVDDDRHAASMFRGVPDQRINVPLRLADSGVTPSVSREQAIATAIWGGVNLPRDSNPAVQEAAVQEIVLLVMKESRPVPHDRLVWGVHFQDAAGVLGGRYQFMGPNADVPHEAEFAIVLVDAVTGDYVLTMEGWNRLETLPPGLTPPPPHPVTE
jgi:hypothetical protein